MRKSLLVAAVAIATVAMPSVAAADDIQSIDASIKPTKLDKKKPKPVTLVINIKTMNNTGAPLNADQPPEATRTVVDFPKNLSFDTSQVPNCEATSAEIQNTTTEAATELCGKKSIISIGGPVVVDSAQKAVTSQTGALVLVDSVPGTPGSAQTQAPIQVTAFNGTEKDTLFLHSKATTLPITNILTGVLNKGKGKFGNSLDVTIPKLPAGGIANFKTTVKAGKYVQGVCKTSKNPFAATTTFTNWTGGGSATDTTETKCKAKKSKK